jgi:hypothetical protein
MFSALLDAKKIGGFFTSTKKVVRVKIYFDRLSTPIVCASKCNYM